MDCDGGKEVETENVEGKISLKSSSNILRIVSGNNAFFFFTEIGQYTGKCSDSLSDFCNMLRTVDVRSVEFHFGRGDFLNWVKGTLGDSELAIGISRVDKTIRGEELRTLVYQAVEARLTELKKLQASEEPYIIRTE
jgi:hypothetical protein